MLDAIVSIIVSVIAAFLYDVFKKMYFDRKKSLKPTTEYADHPQYTKDYVKLVKKEFYYGFFIEIIFSFIPDCENQFSNIFINACTCFSFFVALMGFMCLVEVTDYFFDKDSKDSA